ncbi:MAG: hypothetical protein ACUVRY_01370 [Thermoanaerobaculaceae bacterium]
MPFDLGTLIDNVFAPEQGETVVVACDFPERPEEDTPQWRDRRAWAQEWHQAFAALGQGRGFSTLPLVTFPATGAHGAPLPERGIVGNEETLLEGVLLQATLAVFLTEFSATAALDALTKKKDDFRAASLPGVERRMTETALSADYREVARRCQILFDAMKGAERLEVAFSTGHRCVFDLRFRRPEVDDGFLPRGKVGDRVINLPSGETFIVPYEGEREGIPSQTQGEIPWLDQDQLVVFQIRGNRIAQVIGQGVSAQRFREVFAQDPARTNIAEVAFGCNPKAQITGNVLEDEKAGFHWAYGRSDHLGGTVGVAAFLSPATVVHQDLVYAPGTVALAVAYKPDGPVKVMEKGDYVLF